MKEMGIWQGETITPKKVPITNDADILYINAESSGIFIPAVRLFDHVKKGDLIGTIVNVITGAVEEAVYASGDGMICSMREYPVIEEGSLLARIVGGNGDE